MLTRKDAHPGNDITSQRHAEQELLGHIEFCESVIKTAAEGICVCFECDEYPYVRFTVWNARLTEITGYTLEEIKHVGWQSLLTPEPEQMPSFQDRFRQMFSGLDLKNQEWAIRRKDGDQRIVEVSTSTFNVGNHRQAMVALIQDVTTKHGYKEALRESDERLKLAIEASKLGPWDWDLHTNRVFYSPEWKMQLGYEEHELDGLYSEWENLLHPDDKPRVLKHLQRYVDGISSEYAIEFRMRHKDGSYRWIFTRGVMHGRETGQRSRMLGCHIDVTDRKRAEDALRFIVQATASTTGQEYFSNLVNYLCDSCQVDFAIIAEIETNDPPRARTIAISHRGVMLDNFSYDLTGTPCERMWQEKSMCCYLEDAKVRFPKDAFLQSYDISTYLGTPLWSNQGEPIGMLILMGSDLLLDPEPIKSILQVVGARSGAELERHRAELAIRDSERRLASMAAMMPQALYLFNVDTTETTYQNWHVIRDLGYSDSELTLEMGPHLIGQLVHPDDQPRLEQLHKRWETARDGDIFETEYRLRHKSGKWRTFLGRDTVFERHTDGRVRTVIGTMQDITRRIEAEAERRQLEAQLQHSQKLESLGVLAGGIAHDFNNLLASILTYADLALDSLPQNSPASALIQNAIEGAQNAAELTAQMLAYSGKGTFELKPLNLSKLISETSRLLLVSICKRCTFHLDLPEDIPLCNGDVSQLRQVVMNLIINASEAIGDRGGKITVSVGAEHIAEDDKQQCWIGEWIRAGDYIALMVTDDGCGMNQETARKLFDPFFSTKFSGRGLGMSTVLGIVRGHRGAIQVHSSPGQGSTFRVLLPISSTTPAVVLQEPTVAPWKAQGKILIADDEPGVRNALTILLKSLGLEVITASDGREAVELFRAHAVEIDLVLLDLTMPVMDGVEACVQIRSLRDNIGVILMSGYSEDQSADLSSRCFPYAFLQKPFRANELKRLLQQFIHN